MTLAMNEIKQSTLRLSIKLVGLWFVIFAFGLVGLLCFLWQPWFTSPTEISIDTAVQFFGSIGEVFFGIVTAIIGFVYGSLKIFNRKLHHHQSQAKLRMVECTNLGGSEERIEEARMRLENELMANVIIKPRWERSELTLLPTVDSIDNQDEVELRLLNYGQIQSWLRQAKEKVQVSSWASFDVSFAASDGAIEVYRGVWHCNALKELEHLKSNIEKRLHLSMGFAIAGFLLILLFLSDPLLSHALTGIFGIAKPTNIPSGVFGIYFILYVALSTIIAVLFINEIINIYMLPQDPEI